MDKKPKVYVARADIFKNPTLAKIFTFLKIMPIMRMRDGINEVKKNDKTIEKAVDVLKDKVPFCIFPEGQHQAKHSAQPLSKGIFRIAFQAQELMPGQPLYIVPVGIQYGNFFRFRSVFFRRDSTLQSTLPSPFQKAFSESHSRQWSLWATPHCTLCP
jgi:1-acyl-sn-glycerol-3-phosphate acyltransferase